MQEKQTSKFIKVQSLLKRDQKDNGNKGGEEVLKIDTY